MAFRIHPVHPVHPLHPVQRIRSPRFFEYGEFFSALLSGFSISHEYHQNNNETPVLRNVFRGRTEL